MLLYVALALVFFALIAAFTHPLALLLDMLPIDAAGLLDFLSAARSFIANLLFWALLASVVIMWLLISRERLTRRKGIARPTGRSELALRWEADASPVKMAVALTAYDDAEAIGKAVEDFRSRDGVVEVIVIDNNSRDDTAAVAVAAGARVVRETQQGYGYACIRGLREALAVPEANVIVLCEGDGTFTGADLAKFCAYIHQADMVIGTRVVPHLVEEGSQMDTFFTWGNIVLGTLLRLKFWNWCFLGAARLSDVGCTYRAIRRKGLERILPDLVVGGNHFSPHMMMVALARGLSIVEIPVTFRRRIGESKGASQSLWKGLQVGLMMISHIMTYTSKRRVQAPAEDPMSKGIGADSSVMPERHHLKYRVMDMAGRLGLVRLAFWVYIRGEGIRNPAILWRNILFRFKGVPDGLPLPSMALINLVVGTSDPRYFLESGRREVESIVQILAKNSADTEEFGSILDFGCGCGRVIRQFRALTKAKLHGTDYNPGMVRWCQKNLSRVGEFAVCGSLPPLPYPTGTFDLIYAISVFTHLPEETQHVWIDELSRVLKPGGFLVMSTHGERYVGRLSPRDREMFRSGHVIVKRTEYAGSNLCTAFHPELYVKTCLARGFTVVDFLPNGAKGTPNQDLYLMRKIGH